MFNILSTLPRVSVSQTLCGPLVQGISRGGGRGLFWGSGVLAYFYTEGCYFGTKSHCYHQFNTGFVGVNM